jgi:hypothetical protein
MLYNHRHWFAKKGIMTEYNWNSVLYTIYDMITDANQTKIGLAQRNGCRVYNCSTRVPETLSSFKAKDVGYYEYGNQFLFNQYNSYYQGCYYPPFTPYINYSEYWQGIPTIEVTEKGWHIRNLYPGINPAEIYKPNVIGYVQLTGLKGNIMAMRAVDADNCFVIAAEDINTNIRFRNAAAPTANLSYPSTTLKIDRLQKSTDNLKLYGIAGGHYASSQIAQWIGDTTLYIYDISGNSWISVALPTNLKGCNIIYYNNDIYIIGYNSSNNKACIIPFDGSVFATEIYLDDIEDRLYCGVQAGSKLYLGGYNGKLYSYHT